MSDSIVIRGARLHNLQNVTLAIPKNRLVVFTGLSGSGKSTLVFDTLHKEGQRQYMESLGLVTYAADKSEVDAIEGLSPSISVDQRLSNRSPRSTVGTTTEVFTYLRVLYARIGHRPCPACGGDVPPSHETGATEGWEVEAAEPGPAPDAEAEETYPCPHCGAPIPEIGMAHFSFNKPEGACPTCTGLGVAHEVNVDAVIDPQRSVHGGAVLGWDSFFIARYAESLAAAGRHYGFEFDAGLPVRALGQVQRDLLLYGVKGALFQRHFPGIKPPDTVARGNFEGVLTGFRRRFAGHANDPAYRDRMEGVLREERCPDCGGTRLRPESRSVTVARQTIVDVQRLPLSELAAWLERLRDAVPAQEWAVAAPIVDDLRGRVRRLVDVGVGYLTLDRDSPTLSAGEAQRLRLASLLGSGLTGVLYVLDEPTIGLHPRDTARLIQVLCRLRDLGNTVLVIEHDLEMLSAADYVVDMGPGAGRHGGRVVVAGPPAAVASCAESVTGAYLSGRLSVPVPAMRRPGSGRALVIRGAREHNLKDLDGAAAAGHAGRRHRRVWLGQVVSPLRRAGPGSPAALLRGKRGAGRARRNRGLGRTGQDRDHRPGADRPLAALERRHLHRCLHADPRGFCRHARGAPPGADARHFSFNVPGGRCERCEGAGVLAVEMHFLADVQVRCPACHGRRFKREVLAATLHGHNITQLLDLTIDEALPLLGDVPAAAARLGLMVEAGLGYLPLGQPATTLSGGEAQRVKLARELARRSIGRTLYLLDEPTTGLHPADVARLVAVLQRLVDAGHSVVVVEHNLDVVRAADWVIDLGPDGGNAGGRLVAEGTPEQVALVEASATGSFLRVVRP